MFKPETTTELTEHIKRLLEKHEVHNEVLAIELALLVTRREKTQIKRGYRTAMDILRND